jgi:pyruvate kinase
MRIIDLKPGDYIRLKNGSIQLKVIEQSRDNKFDYVIVYNDVTDTTKKLINLDEPDYIKV